MACEVDKGIVIDQGHSKWEDFLSRLPCTLKKKNMNKVDII
jgi:hypothetical protein